MPARMAYSATAMVTWVRAVSLIPATAITIMTSTITVAMVMSGHAVAGCTPAIARTLGPITSTPDTAPVMYAAIISQPVNHPSHGEIARPTHSKLAPQFAFHKFSRRYAFAMISIGTAVTTITSPPE